MRRCNVWTTISRSKIFHLCCDRTMVYIKPHRLFDHRVYKLWMLVDLGIMCLLQSRDAFSLCDCYMGGDGTRHLCSTLLRSIAVISTLSHRGAIPPVLRTSAASPTSHTYCVGIPTDERSDRDVPGLSMSTHAGFSAGE